MALQESVQGSTWSLELAAWFEQLRGKAVSFALAGLYFVGLILAGSPEQFRHKSQHVWLALCMFFLAFAVWLLRMWRERLATWTLIVGTLAANVLAATWGGLEPAICLLFLPVGLAALAIGTPAGASIAVVCTLFLLLAPGTTLAVATPLRAIASLAVWGVVGIIWLTLDSLLAAVQWSWTNYEQGRVSLEQAREYQVQLHETMQDLASANVQLTRMNQLAYGLRQSAEEERRAKEQFVANVSHELRTPLNMIVGFCEMITESPETYGDQIPPTLLADLTVVLRNSQHLSGLIDDVLDLSQIEAGQMALTKERVPLAEVVRSAAVAIRPLFASKKLQLETEIPDDLPPVFCDRTRIREVILNLLSNAGRFTDCGGAKVQVRQDGGDVVVSVADTGPGIADEAQDRIFRPFQQSDGSIRRRYGGTGLGLSISKSFVELHGGTMWIESATGRGTTIFFRLPIAPPVAVESEVLRWVNPYQVYEERARPSHLRSTPVPPRLVVVERGSAMRRLLTRYLDGTEIVPASTVEQAVEQISQTSAKALLINDVNVGDALRRLKGAAALPHDIPTIICSIPGIEQTTSDLGVFDYLVKPVSRESLLASLARLEREVETVLIVDDEPDAQQLFRRMLASEERQHRVLRASNGQQAMEIMQQERPDAILLDLMMPEMNGFQFLAEKEQDPSLREIPTILISARDPLGHPIMSDALAVTCADGLSVRELLASVEALSAVFAPARPSTDRAPTAKLPG